MPDKPYCQTYPTPGASREAVEQLLAAGTPPREVLLLVGRRMGDIRLESVGSFAGAIAPDGPIGTFAGVKRLRRRAAGGWAGDPDSRRQGSFGDAEHDKVVSFDHGREVSRTVDRRALIHLLRPVAIDTARADVLINDLHQGHALMLVARAQTALSDGSTQQEQPLMAA